MIQNSSQKAFTLLEILIAISIFAVIASIVYGSLNAIISRNSAIKGGTASFEMAKNCLNRISMDLKALYVVQYPEYRPPDFDDPSDPYGFFGETEYVGSKQFSAMAFASTEHLPISSGDPEGVPDVSGIGRIRYHVERSGDSGDTYVLKRGDTAFPYDTEYHPLEDDSDPVICRNIEALKFLFYDMDGNSYEYWDSDADDVKFATPRAVDILLKIKTDQDIHPFATRVDLPVYRERLESVER